MSHSSCCLWATCSTNQYFYCLYHSNYLDQRDVHGRRDLVLDGILGGVLDGVLVGVAQGDSQDSGDGGDSMDRSGYTSTNRSRRGCSISSSSNRTMSSGDSPM
jgi:hypothetical protein